MQLKNSTRTLFIIVAEFILFFGLVFYFVLKKQKGNSPAPLVANTNVFYGQEKLEIGLPVRFKIPVINVDATVNYVGITPEGEVDVPKGPAEVAWFNLSPRPGEPGSSIIDGHSGYKNNRQAVFDNLYKLVKGDKIYIEDSKGVITTFVVRESQRYNPKANPMEVFSSDDGKSHLNLITCTGIWDKTEKTHSDRLVVFTDREIEE